MSMSIFEYNQELHFRQIAEETLGWTAKQAMVALKIPEEQWEKYIQKIKKTIDKYSVLCYY